MAPRDSEIKFSPSLLYLTLLNQVPAFQNNDEDSIIHSSISLNLLWCIGSLILKLCPDSICSFFPIKISCCNRSSSTSTNGILWPWRRHYNNTINMKWKSEIEIVVCRWFTYCLSCSFNPLCIFSHSCQVSPIIKETRKVTGTTNRSFQCYDLPSRKESCYRFVYFQWEMYKSRLVSLGNVIQLQTHFSAALERHAFL